MPQLSPPDVAVQVREARPSDRRAVRAVLLAAYREYAASLPPAVFGPYLADVLDLDARDGGSGGLKERRSSPPVNASGRLLVAERAGRVVGTVTWYDDAAAEGLGWPSGWAGLRALGVDPATRGHGVGRALVEACRRRALAAGAPVLCLHTAGFMTAAVALYEAMGFRRDPSFDFEATSHLRVAGLRPIPILAYRLDLPGGARDAL
jgi:GNAT superfamily N-acetyltransferase